jgi:hypothetical protein
MIWAGKSERVMFEDKGNWIGIGLLILCGLSAGTMLGYIEAGERARWTGPGWLGIVLIVAFLGLLIFGAVRRFRGGSLGDDVRSDRPWWRRDKGQN